DGVVVIVRSGGHGDTQQQGRDEHQCRELGFHGVSPCAPIMKRMGQDLSEPRVQLRRKTNPPGLEVFEDTFRRGIMKSRPSAPWPMLSALVMSLLIAGVATAQVSQVQTTEILNFEVVSVSGNTVVVNGQDGAR